MRLLKQKFKDELKFQTEHDDQYQRYIQIITEISDMIDSYPEPFTFFTEGDIKKISLLSIEKQLLEVPKPEALEFSFGNLSKNYLKTHFENKKKEN